MDSWDGERGYVYFDNNLIIDQTLSDAPNTYYEHCGSFGWNRFRGFTIVSALSHTSASINIKF